MLIITKDSVDAAGEKITAVNFYMVYNSSVEQINYKLPKAAITIRQNQFLPLVADQLCY